MIRERALRVVVALVGLAFIAGAYPLISSLLKPGGVSPGDQMILGIYLPIGVFLLRAVRQPAAHRSLIMCVGWSNLCHAAVMAVQAIGNPNPPSGPVSISIITIVSVALILLPRRGEPVAQGAAEAQPVIGVG